MAKEKLQRLNSTWNVSEIYDHPKIGHTDVERKELNEALSQKEKVEQIAEKLVNWSMELKDVKFDTDDEWYELALYLSKNWFWYIDYLWDYFAVFADKVDFEAYKEWWKIIGNLVKADFKKEVEQNISKIVFIPFQKMIEWFGRTEAMRIMEENCDKVTFDICIEDEDDTSFINEFIDKCYTTLWNLSFEERERGCFHPEYIEWFDVNWEVMAHLISHWLSKIHYSDYWSDNYEAMISLLKDFVDAYINHSFSDIQWLVRTLDYQTWDLIDFLKANEQYEIYHWKDRYRILVADLIKNYKKQRKSLVNFE